MELDRESILAFLSRPRQGGASIRDLVHSLAVPPSRRVVGVRERSKAGIPGRFADRGKNTFVVPDGKRMGGDLFVSRKDAEGAQNGDLVLVEVIQAAMKDFFAKAKVVKVLGDRDDPG